MERQQLTSATSEQGVGSGVDTAAGDRKTSNASTDAEHYQKQLSLPIGMIKTDSHGDAITSSRIIKICLFSLHPGCVADFCDFLVRRRFAGSIHTLN